MLFLNTFLQLKRMEHKHEHSLPLACHQTPTTIDSCRSGGAVEAAEEGGGEFVEITFFLLCLWKPLCNPTQTLEPNESKGIV